VSTSTTAATPLSKLPLGGRARVMQIEGDDEVSIRLMEMGLVPGVELVLLGVAPLGDPLELELRGYRLSVRKAEAARILVKVIYDA
jgi:ferrous iron transport protein A